MVPHGQGQLFISMNFLVHAVMYSYYAIRAQGLVRIPLWVSVGVTSLQLLQMVLGVALYVDAYLMLRNGVPCNVKYTNIYFGLGIYFSYAVLFGHFFYVSYVKKKKND
jgi:elongation of very long chain fatty acids protein 6